MNAMKRDDFTSESFEEPNSENSPPWEDLKNEFLHTLKRTEKSSPQTWYTLWQLFVKHPWYRAELTLCARRVIRQLSLPGEWQKDVEQDAVLILARKLQKDPHLGVDLQQVQTHFPGWISTIITYNCKQALRRLRNIYSNEKGTHCPLAVHKRHEYKSRLMLSQAIDELQQPQKVVLKLYLQAFTFQQIAENTSLSYWEVYRTFHRGLKQLKQSLLHEE